MTDVTDSSGTAAPPPEPPAEPPSAPRLGWRAERRPSPGFAHVLGAVAGVFAVVAMVAFVVAAAGDDPQTVGIIFSLVLVAAAKLLGFKAPGPVRSACTAALVLAVPVLWFFALVGGGDFGRAEYRGALILTTLSYLALYLLGWTVGRGVFLAGTLLVFTSWISFEIAASGGGLVPFQDQISSSASSTVDVGSFGSSGSSTGAAVVTMLLGLAFLAAGASLDRRRLVGVATPFVAVGAYETVIGAVALGASESTLVAGLLAIAAGAIVGLVAARGENRRASTWFGAIAVFGGMVAIIADVAPSSAAGVGGIATAFTVVLGAIAWRLAPVLGEPDDGRSRRRPHGTPGAPGSPLPCDLIDPEDPGPQASHRLSISHDTREDSCSRTTRAVPRTQGSLHVSSRTRRAPLRGVPREPVHRRDHPCPHRSSSSRARSA